MEPERNCNNLYICSVFEKKQKWIWTCDKRTGLLVFLIGSHNWVVGFFGGYCFYDYNVNIALEYQGFKEYYVRAVR